MRCGSGEKDDGKMISEAVTGTILAKFATHVKWAHPAELRL
jgi:hypothetical protein